MADLVHLTVVSSEDEAEVICAFLRVNGIECEVRLTDSSAGAYGATGSSGGWREVVVGEPHLASARELLASRTD